jgi:hypothetical protein
MLKHVVAAAVVLGFAGGEVRADEKKPAKAPLPHADTVTWDVSAFENSAAFEAVKREVKNGQVVWVLENRRNLMNEFLFGYRAEFLDEDGVKLSAVEIRWGQLLANLMQGERNRLILELPKPEAWKNVSKVVIRGG